ncbi:MAG: chemotaxis response regulator protein-glutamate methylesterase [Gammaproteobacteria bacterium]|nr:chemotaxis response regulator protein-glutamate methylesterase [Gammaproteobacteria bacterium]
MAVRVLAVDDSGFFLRRLTEMLNGDPRIEVVGTAVDGRDAIRKTQELKPDVITMDIEMPVMDGISAVRRIMSIQPTPVLMFSSLTHEGAQATFEALEAGALDYLPKNFDDISNNRDEVAKVLRSRVWMLGIRGLPKKPSLVKEKKPLFKTKSSTDSSTKASSKKATVRPVSVASRKGSYRLVAIGTSTGGPVALQEVLTALPREFPLPLVIVQHMPASFTDAFAKRLDQMCAIHVKEASDGDVLEAGTALLAPGGKQMLVTSRGDQLKIKIQDSEPGQNYKPCVDITFTSIAETLPGKSLSIVMTGMGADGAQGAKLLKQGGGDIWVQDEDSCVIYGMPMAIAKEGLADQELSLADIGPQLAESV